MCDGALSTGSHGVAVHCEGIGITVVEAIPLDEVELHREKAVLAGEFDMARDLRVFASLLAPVIEDVTRCQYSRGRYYCLNHVGAIEACLLVYRTIRES